MSTWGNLSNDFNNRQPNIGSSAFNTVGGPSGGIQRAGLTNYNDQFPALGSSPNGDKKTAILSPAAQLAQQLNQSHNQQQQSSQESLSLLQSARPGSQKQNALSILNAIKQSNGLSNTATTTLPPGLGNASPGINKDKKLSSFNNNTETKDNTTDTTTTPINTNIDRQLEKQDTQQEPLDQEELEDFDKFGLKGLLPFLRNETSDQALIVTGLDLNMLGLDLSSKEKLSKTFASPWLETSRSEVEPLFVTPKSFNIESSNLIPVENRINTFNDETLFFMFYSKPRDILQELVARELNSRNWRYHKDLQVWLTKDSSIEPTPNGPGSEQGTYIFFDPTSWEYVTKEFVLNYNSII